MKRDYLAHLSEEEKALVLRAPVLVTVLIAGADEHIDEKEQRKAIAMSAYRKATASTRLRSYYEALSADFEANLIQTIADMPDTAAARSPLLVEELTKLNAIFAKLNPRFAKDLYDDLRSFAKRVASASGGVLGYFSTSDEEAEWVDLPMLNDPTPV